VTEHTHAWDWPSRAEVVRFNKALILQNKALIRRNKLRIRRNKLRIRRLEAQIFGLHFCYVALKALNKLRLLRKHPLKFLLKKRNLSAPCGAGKEVVDTGDNPVEHGGVSLSTEGNTATREVQAGSENRDGRV